MDKININDYKDVDNVYRTKNFIITQKLTITPVNANHTELISYDIFYKRNYLRDLQFNQIFSSRNNLNGKRIISTIAIRKYADKQ